MSPSWADIIGADHLRERRPADRLGKGTHEGVEAGRGELERAVGWAYRESPRLS